MPTKHEPRWIAFRFPDPMCSPRIKQESDLAALLSYLVAKDFKPEIYGPAIYYRPVIDGVLAHERRDVRPLGTWVGGMKIRLFEGVEPPPAPGVEFIRQIQFIDEGNQDGEKENGTEVRNDGSGAGRVWDQTDDVR
jgi:hypothetical protein